MSFLIFTDLLPAPLEAPELTPVSEHQPYPYSPPPTSRFNTTSAFFRRVGDSVCITPKSD